MMMMMMPEIFSVVSKVSDFELDEEELGNFLNENDQEYLIWKAAAVQIKMSHPHLQRRAIVALSLQAKMLCVVCRLPTTLTDTCS